MRDEDIPAEPLVDRPFQVLRVSPGEDGIEEEVPGLKEGERDQERDRDHGRREDAGAGDDQERNGNQGPGPDPLEEPLRVSEQHPAHPCELVGEEAQLL